MNISAYQQINIRMSTRGKRPLRNLTPSDKVRAIQRIHNGETKASVSRDIGVPESTLRGWCKNEQKLRFMCRQLGTEQLSVPSRDTPPEKRSKFDHHGSSSKFSTLSNLPNLPTEIYGFNQLPLREMDITSSIGANHNENYANRTLNEFFKAATLQNAENSLLGLGTESSSGIVSPISVIQNLDLLNILNPNFVSMQASNYNRLLGNITKPQLPNLIENSQSSPKINSPITVKNWAKDADQDSIDPETENDSINDSLNESLNDSINDSNNNDVKSQTGANNNQNENDNVPTLMPLDFSLIPSPILSNGENNSGLPLLEWYKVFNASLNFLALAAAAASISPPLMQGSDENSDEETKAGPADESPKNNNSTATSTSLSSEVSNDSYMESEPEDLSLGSSPTKSTMSISSNLSDTEQ